MKLKCTTCGELCGNLPDWKLHSHYAHGGRADYELAVEPGEELPKVEPTPRLADECKKLLDNGWRISLFKNNLGSYTARARKATGACPATGKLLYASSITDDFEPSAALYRLTEKVFGNIA